MFMIVPFMTHMSHRMFSVQNDMEARARDHCTFFSKTSTVVELKCSEVNEIKVQRAALMSIPLESILALS